MRIWEGNEPLPRLCLTADSHQLRIPTQLRTVAQSVSATLPVRGGGSVPDKNILLFCSVSSMTA